MLYIEDRLYSTSMLANDLMDLHKNHIIDIYATSFSKYPREVLTRNIVENRDNNNITTYIV